MPPLTITTALPSTMYTLHNAHGAGRPIEHPVLLPEPSQDSRWHQHDLAERRRNASRAAKERHRMALLARARAMDMYQTPKVIEEDVRDIRISPLQLRPNSLTPAVRASPLFRLPVHLREKIFAYALASPHPVPVKKHTAVVPGQDQGRVQKVSWRWFPALLKVSRQVEAEAAPVFYRVNVFEAKIRGVDSGELRDWVAETEGRLLSEVQQFTVVLEATCLGDLLGIVEVKSGEEEGLGGEAGGLARVVREGLPGAGVKVKGPKKGLKALRVDCMRVGVGKGVAEGLWREWKGEVERAMAGD